MSSSDYSNGFATTIDSTFGASTSWPVYLVSVSNTIHQRAVHAFVGSGHPGTVALRKFNARYQFPGLLKSLRVLRLDVARNADGSKESREGGWKNFFLAIGKWKVERNSLSPGQLSFSKRKSFTQSLRMATI